MYQQNETGLAKNMANFEKMVVFVSGLGEYFNPSNEILRLQSLENLLSATKQAFETLSVAEAARSKAITERESVFKSLGFLITRVSNALKASGSSAPINEGVYALVRKLRGRRATPRKTSEEKEAAKAIGKEIKEISSSQMSFDSRIDNFDKLVKLLESIPEYAPNEPDLTISALNNLRALLSEKNTGVINARAALSMARINRDKLLYRDASGIIDVSLGVKYYIKSVFGATSPQFDEISSLEFVKRK
jgi:hypothetical protein